MKNSGRKTVKVAAQETAGKVSKASKTKQTGPVALASADAATLLPTHEEIAVRSYELFLARGGIHGHDVEDWLQAESELSA